MKRFALITVCVLSLVAFSATSAFAQDNPNRLDEQPWSMSFGVPSGGNSFAPGTFGIWKMVSSSLNLGMNFGFGLDTAGDTSVDVLLAPTIKNYFHTNTTVLPYLYGQLNFRIVDEADTDVGLSLAGGFGVEWFPVPVFSIGGHAGIGFDIVDPGSDFALGTFQSGLSAQFYFR